jgi:UDP-N-acetylmuramoyl-tripeptide--D-alanyl-D-alanine ligase
MARSLSAVAGKVSGQLIGSDASFGVVGTDTRSLPAGSLFVAIEGQHFDGNDYVAAAAARGAVGALVSRVQDLPLPQIKVADTRQAFGAMARAWRENFEIPVVAVTGSAGKTTVKELIGAILGTRRKICVTEGNLNNDIGVPLSLMRLEATDAAMVVELGANHAGEILHLGQLVEPTIAVITNAGAAHLEGFGSVAGVAQAKGELIDCLPENGVAVLNADDAYFAEWRQRAGARRVVSFGFSPSAEVRLIGEAVVKGGSSHFALALPNGDAIQARLPLLGRANIANALAAAAAAYLAGATGDDIRAGLEQAQAVRGRMHRLAGKHGATIIDDSYNANPSAARAALDYLAGCTGQRIFVLGDMLELGPDAGKLHREIGVYARGRCERLVSVGALAAEAAEAFGPGSERFSAIEPAAAAVAADLAPAVTVLVKASRSVGLERLVAALVDTEGSAAC